MVAGGLDRLPVVERFPDAIDHREEFNASRRLDDDRVRINPNDRHRRHLADRSDLNAQTGRIGDLAEVRWNSDGGQTPLKDGFPPEVRAGLATLQCDVLDDFRWVDGTGFDE